MRAILVFVLSYFPFYSLAANLQGSPRVIDGDTIEIASTKIRLFGIDAPESKQTCFADKSEYACGEAAAQALRDLISDREVRCEERGRDRYRRILAVCWVGETEINAWMVRSGYALAFVRYTKTYVTEEAEAKSEKRGVWRGEFVYPWDWRSTRGIMGDQD